MIRLKGALWALAVLSLFSVVACVDEGILAPETFVASDLSPQAMHLRGVSPVLPLKASTRGMMVGMEPAPAGRCPAERPILVSYLGTGNATHMGRIGVTGSECLFGDPADPTTLQSGEGVFTLTAANEDELVIGYDRTLLRMEGPSSPWVLWSAQIYAKDGTGRFETAQLVDAVWSGGLNLLTYETWSEIDGGIRVR